MKYAIAIALILPLAGCSAINPIKDIIVDGTPPTADEVEAIAIETGNFVVLSETVVGTDRAKWLANGLIATASALNELAQTNPSELTRQAMTAAVNEWVPEQYQATGRIVIELLYSRFGDRLDNALLLPGEAKAYLMAIYNGLQRSAIVNFAIEPEVALKSLRAEIR